MVWTIKSSVKPSGLKHCERIRSILVQIPLGSRLSLGTQPRYEASVDLRVKNSHKPSD